MDPSGRSYEDFVPPHSMVRVEPTTHTLTVDLSTAGYKKEHIRVQLVHSHRRLVVRGERPVAGNRWSRFRLEVTIPDGCDTKGVHARYEKGVVRVVMPGVAPELVAADGGGGQQEPAKPAAAATASAGVQDRRDVSSTAKRDGGGRAAPARGGEEEDKAQKKQQELQRASSGNDYVRQSTGVEGEVAAGSPSRGGGGYAFFHDRRKMATTVFGVVLVLISLGIYIKYSLWP
ncbi:hypothetical protein ACP4OV_027796 [Aristida adscensionis]